MNLSGAAAASLVALAFDGGRGLLDTPSCAGTVEKLVEFVAGGIHVLEASDSGLEWRTQGSGKTLRMLVAASLWRGTLTSTIRR